MSVEPCSAHTSEPGGERARPALSVRLTVSSAALLAVLGALALLGYAAALVAYIMHPGFTDHVEPGIACISSLLFQGLQLYPMDPATPPFGMQYGALSYLPAALFMLMIEDTIVATKLPAVLAGGAGLAAATLLFRRLSSWPLALIHGGVLAAWLLMLLQRSYWGRPDPYLLLLVSAALWTVEMKRPQWAPIILGILLGAIFGLKINAVAALLPLIGMMGNRLGWLHLTATFSIACLVALLPFFFPNVSLPGFLTMLFVPFSQGLHLNQFKNACAIGGQMLLPLGLVLAAAGITDYRALLREFRRHWAFWIALPVSFLVVALVCSKLGADTQHFVPLLPVIAYALLRVSLILRDSWRQHVGAESPRFAPAAAVLLLALVAQAAFLVYRDIDSQKKIWRMYRINTPIHRLLREDQDRVVASLPGKRLAMGFGDGGAYVATWRRSELLRLGHPYLVEPNNLMDLQSAGKEIFPRRALDPAEVDAWIIPRSGKPFSMLNWNRTGHMLPQEFQDRFLREWELKEASQAFDIYFPRAKPGVPREE